MKEIITFSLGNNSNYTSTHFWNLHDESLKSNKINHCLFYESEIQIVPRHIHFDFQNNFGNYISQFSIKEDTNNTQLWEGNISKVQQEEIEKSQFQQELDKIDEEEEKEENKGDDQEILMQMISQSQFLSKNMMQNMIQQKPKEKKEEKSIEDQYKQIDLNNNIKYFTDYQQSLMTKKNLQFIPHNLIDQDNFKFYNQGLQIWNEDFLFRENSEDLIRQQLEMCDNIDGIQMICDYNSGFTSYLYTLITNIIKDEVPKSTLLLYSLANQQTLQDEIQTKLFNLNKSFYLGNLSQVCDIIIPFDQINVNSFYLQQYQNNLFQQSSIYSLTIDNILYESYSQKQNLREYINSLMYGNNPNIALAQIQYPYIIQENENFLEKINMDKIQKNYIQFNQSKEQQFRDTFIFNINQIQVQRHQAIEYIQNFIMKNSKYERGFQVFVDQNQQILPLPYPRIFTENLFNCNGFLKHNQKNNEFINQIPTLTKIIYDDSYLEEINQCIHEVRNMKKQIKVQLCKDYLYDDEEQSNLIEILSNMKESFAYLSTQDPENKNFM